ELTTLRHDVHGSATAYISRWREKMLLMVDMPSKKEQVEMIMRSLQPRYERSIAAMEITDFITLRNALFRVEDAIARDLWSDSSSPSPADGKGKRPSHSLRQSDVVAIIAAR
ncbi:hypothetical protein, partial [Heyndrickxia coagulans]|uniref:hypothetical protein n=1 Tax=Heyndrickxia coagulans TaxID=1398 RepID=UPI00214DD982